MEYQKHFLERWKEALIAVLVVANLLVWIGILDKKEGRLKVIFFDVGQGDAIFVETPSRKQMLIDGGRNRKVVAELGRAMSFGDRSLDVVVATHPDADHIGGLPEVFERYEVGLFIEPGVESGNALDDELGSRVNAEKSQTLFARTGQVIDFGDGAKLEIIFPHVDVSSWETNDASIVARLSYGESSFLLTGDAGVKTENILLKSAKELIDVDVLKVGHHGSRTSTSLSFAQAASPVFAVISAGKDNAYGHPHREVMNILEKVGAQIKSTAESGALVFETDGHILRLR